MSLSRLKHHGVGGAVNNPQILVCADCGTADPGWAVLNRGVLICNDCCSVHRSLGRDISQIRSLKNGSWHQNEMSLVHTLFCNGSNNIWEHALLDPNSPVARSVRKPQPRDPVYPTKNDFIHSKYKQQLFTAKQNPGESPMQWHDINRQMWSCVRTGHVETTLRMLALGADPNYAHTNGCTPMHVAAKENQALQIELLFVYGGDVCQRDVSGRTPYDWALANGHVPLAERLVQLQYECTDRLAMYLCGRTPSHKKQVHFVIPEMAAVSDNEMPVVIMARRRMQALTNEALEHLVQDVYDEVDRRDNDAAWLTAMAPYDAQAVNERYIVPFLPVNNTISATRNQSRQKLAKFDAREFAGLIIDVLMETKRRQSLADGGGKSASDSRDSGDLLKLADCNTSGNSGGGRQASDHLVMSSSAHSQLDTTHNDLVKSTRSVDDVRKSGTGNEQPLPTTVLTANGGNESLVQLDDYMELREKLDRQHDLIGAVATTNKQILRQLAEMNKKVDKLNAENNELRSAIARQSNAQPRSPSSAHMNGQHQEDQVVYADVSRGSRARSPVKSVVPSTGRRSSTPPTSTPHSRSNKASSAIVNSFSSSQINQINHSPVSPLHRLNTPPTVPPKTHNVPVQHGQQQPPTTLPLFKQQFSRVSTSPAPERASVDSSVGARSPDYSHISACSSDQVQYLSSVNLVREVTNGYPTTPQQQTHKRTHPRRVDYRTSSSRSSRSERPDPKLAPYPDNVILQTEQLTALIQRLLADAQNTELMQFEAYAKQMSALVDGMVGMVPSDLRTNTNNKINTSLSAMVDACVTLKVRCSEAQRSDTNDVSSTTHTVNNAVQAAYGVAKHAKQVLAWIQADSPDNNNTSSDDTSKQPTAV